MGAFMYIINTIIYYLYGLYYTNNKHGRSDILKYKKEKLLFLRAFFIKEKVQ